MITPEEFASRMQNIQNTLNSGGEYDESGAHGLMDKLMIDTLKSLGYKEGCDIFLNTPKWYA